MRLAIQTHKPSQALASALNQEISLKKKAVFNAAATGNMNHLRKGLFLLKHYRSLLGKKKLSVNGMVDDRGYTLLHHAAQNGNNNAIEFLLQREHAQLNVLTPHSRTPLHLAAQEGKVHTVKLLHEKYGAALDTMSNTGSTPFTSAIINGHIRVADYFKRCGLSLYKPLTRSPIWQAFTGKKKAMLDCLLAGEKCAICLEDVKDIDALHFIPCCQQWICGTDYSRLKNCFICKKRIHRS